jgi:hypothetical protein
MLQIRILQGPSLAEFPLHSTRSHPATPFLHPRPNPYSCSDAPEHRTHEQRRK